MTQKITKRAFSLVELLISLIVISCITAAFAPVITKKQKQLIYSGSMSEVTTNCADKFGLDCSMCYTTKCIVCNKACNDGYFKNTGKCQCEQCSALSESCEKCIENACTKCAVGYKINQDYRCEVCPEGTYSSDGISCEVCPEGQYQDAKGQSACKKCSDKWANCKTCDIEGCKSCNAGFEFNNGTCLSSDLIQVGNLLVTKYNMGDKDTLPIPSTVPGNSSICGESYPCCQKGTTSSSCNQSNGDYSGCKRTVCNYAAAKEICSKFNRDGKKWRLPTPEEISGWASYSVGLELGGLQLCDANSGYSSSKCASKIYQMDYYTVPYVAYPLGSSSSCPWSGGSECDEFNTYRPNCVMSSVSGKSYCLASGSLSLKSGTGESRSGLCYEYTYYSNEMIGNREYCKYERSSNSYYEYKTSYYLNSVRCVTEL